MGDLYSENYLQTFRYLNILNPLKYIYFLESLIVKRIEEKIFSSLDYDQFSQIYDIIRKDGFRNDDEKEKKYNFFEAKKIIEKALGKPKKIRKISDCYIGVTAKKFDSSDFWELPEYE